MQLWCEDLKDYVNEIRNSRVYEVAQKTPVDHAGLLSDRLENKILLKREDLQPVFSFKLRGAYNKLCKLSKEQRATGVVAASAGNHAQGLAMAAKQLNIIPTIVMPTTTPQIKLNAVRHWGAEILLHGDTFDQALIYAKKLEVEKGLIFVDPFDDPDVIVGQGTVGLEIVNQIEDPLDAIFVPVGGGGLLAGIATYVSQVWSKTKIFGVEPEDAACLKAALKNGSPTELKEVGLFVDGCAVSLVGSENYRLIRPVLEDVITVSTDEICSAIKDIFEDTRVMAEPAGALALAGLKKFVLQNKVTDSNLLAILSGSNTNFDRLRYISERTEIGERREAVISVSIPEEPGSFLKFCASIGKRNITEFNYRFNDSNRARVFVGLSIQPNKDDIGDLISRLDSEGYEAIDLTDNEMAKLHIRYMVGGQVRVDQPSERAYRVEFPERPGALLKFLQGLGDRWNISMFHYRNHGAAYGRILLGAHVPEDQKKSFETLLSGIGYPFSDETDDPAYKLYLGGGR